MKSKKQKRPSRTPPVSPPSGKTPTAEASCLIGPTMWLKPGKVVPKVMQAIAALMADAQSVAQCEPKRFREQYYPQLCSLADILVGDSPGYLCKLAEMGNPAAIRQLAQAAIRATECLEKVAESHAELLTPIAGMRRTWPLMVSRRQFENRRLQRVLDTVKLGGPKAASKFKFDTPIIRYTEELRQHFARMHGFIRSVREECAAEKKEPLDVGAILMEHVGVGGLITKEEIPIFEETWKLEKEWRQNPKLPTEWKWAKHFTRWVKIKHGSLGAFWDKMEWKRPKGDARLQGKTEEEFAEALAKLGPPVK